MAEIFSPNNHSAAKVLWTAVAAEPAAEVREVLLLHYGLSAVGEILQVGAWEVRSHNFKVSAGEKTLLVKKNIAWKDEPSLALVERVLRYLHEKNVPAPVIVPALNGAAHVGFGDHLWQVFEFISGDYFAGTETELVAAAGAFARLHIALAEIPFAAELQGRAKAVSAWSREKLLDFFAATNLPAAVVEVLGRDRALIEARLVELEGNAALMRAARRQIVRNSLHPHDTLFVGGRLQAIIDFEEIGENELARDVGNACHRFVRQYVVCAGDPWRETLGRGLRLFLDAYRAVNPLSENELLLLPLFIKDELLRKLQSTLTKLAAGENVEKYTGEVLKFLGLLREADAVGEAIATYARGRARGSSPYQGEVG